MSTSRAEGEGMPARFVTRRAWLSCACAVALVGLLFLLPWDWSRARAAERVIALPEGGCAPASVLQDQMSDLEAQLSAAWNSGDWPLAIQTIEQIISLDPSRSEMQDNLYSAHVNYGYQLYATGQLDQAQAEFESALQSKPEGEEAQAGIILVQQAQASGTPVPTATHTPVSTGVPTTTPAPSGTPTVEPTHYVVRTGDTLYSLAGRFDTTVQAIMQANGLSSYIIWIGQELVIPPAGTLPAGPMMHIVLPGDTLYSLACEYQTTVQAIMWANGLSSYTIYVGQPLYIPTSSPSSGTIHVVQSGETLYSIAGLYDTTVDAIKAANGLTSDLIIVGMELKIP